MDLLIRSGSDKCSHTSPKGWHPETARRNVDRPGREESAVLQGRGTDPLKKSVMSYLLNILKIGHFRATSNISLQRDPEPPQR